MSEIILCRADPFLIFCAYSVSSLMYLFDEDIVFDRSRIEDETSPVRLFCFLFRYMRYFIGIEWEIVMLPVWREEDKKSMTK